MANQSFLNELDLLVNQGWKNIRKNRFFSLVQSHSVDRDLYCRMMTEIYHYTKHNAINQAAAAFGNHSTTQPHNTPHSGLLRFAFKHASEELGHENMVVRDLESIGLLQHDVLKQAPLPATEALIGYLYYVAMRYGVIARLGYSFWAEDVYHQIGQALDKIKSDLQLSNKNMSFFVAHSHIDQRHSEEVKEAIMEFVETKEDENNLRQVALTTLFLTGAMLDAIAHEYISEQVSKAA